MLTQVVAQEVWPHGIDVNEVVPGPVYTRSTEDIFRPDAPPPFAPSERVIIGYPWLLRIGAGDTRSAAWAWRLTAVLYGVGSGLTLDEFALWLRLEDVYWSREGMESIEAVILFGGLLSVGLWGGRFFHALARDAMRTPEQKETSHTTCEPRERGP